VLERPVPWRSRPCRRRRSVLAAHRVSHRSRGSKADGCPGRRGRPASPAQDTTGPTPSGGALLGRRVSRFVSRRSSAVTSPLGPPPARNLIWVRGTDTVGVHGNGLGVVRISSPDRSPAFTCRPPSRFVPWRTPFCASGRNRPVHQSYGSTPSNTGPSWRRLNMTPLRLVIATFGLTFVVTASLAMGFSTTLSSLRKGSGPTRNLT
jgi:hypothetical protein